VSFKGILKYVDEFSLKNFGETLGQIDEILESIFQGREAEVLFSAVDK
jgi:hypothetical protein